MNPWYKDYSEYLSEKFPGMKVQKLSINAGFSCPNRDGMIGTGGCIYCDNSSFTPKYCNPADSVTRQIQKGKAFFARKYPEMKYLAYFQSFTGTHAEAMSTLRAIYEEAIAQKDIIGLIIGTRPDALPDKVIKLLAEINRTCPVIVEIGAETSFDSTLKEINRCHTWEDVENAVRRLSDHGIESGLHLIAGLPGEENEQMLETVERSCRLPIVSIKLHQLQIIRNTTLHKMWLEGTMKVKQFSIEDYLNLCIEIIKTVDRRVTIERFLASAPPDMVVSPKWGLKNYQFTNLLHNKLRTTYFNK